jgi:hypothetical protein
MQLLTKKQQHTNLKKTVLIVVIVNSSGFWKYDGECKGKTQLTSILMTAVGRHLLHATTRAEGPVHAISGYSPRAIFNNTTCRSRPNAVLGQPFMEA